MKTTELITQDHLRQFHEEGYFILEHVITEEHLELLRAELDRYVAEIDAEMDASGSDVAGLNHRGKRYFVALRYKAGEPLEQFLFSPLMAEIAKATLGPDVWMFWEQFVVKFAEVGMKFSWHQDSGYLKQSLPGHERPYLTCWCALDDVDESNGTVYLLPFSRAGTTRITEHVRDPETNDLVGYTGDDPGMPVIVPAGSIAVFQTTVLHRSGPNTTGKPRRVYVAQYSAEPIVDGDGKPRGFIEPFLRDGRIVHK